MIFHRGLGVDSQCRYGSWFLLPRETTNRSKRALLNFNEPTSSALSKAYENFPKNRLIILELRKLPLDSSSNGYFLN